MPFKAGTDLWRRERSGSRATSGSRQPRRTEEECSRPAGFFADLPTGNQVLDPLPHLGPFLDSLEAPPKKTFKLVAQYGPGVASRGAVLLARQAARESIDEAA
jgi:hypothetical protein